MVSYRIVDDLECSGGFILNASCYVVYKNETVNWFTAVNRCLSLRGSLAVFQRNFLDYINSTLIPGRLHYLFSTSFHSSWIGLVKPWWTWPSTLTEIYAVQGVQNTLIAIVQFTSPRQTRHRQDGFVVYGGGVNWT